MKRWKNAKPFIFTSKIRYCPQAQPNHFTMKRFQNIKGKMQRDREEAAAARSPNNRSVGHGSEEEDRRYEE